MLKKSKARINKPVALISALAGGGIWFLCSYLYSLYKLKIPGVLLVPILFTLLFAVVFHI